MHTNFNTVDVILLLDSTLFFLTFLLSSLLFIFLFLLIKALLGSTPLIQLLHLIIIYKYSLTMIVMCTDYQATLTYHFILVTFIRRWFMNFDCIDVMVTNRSASDDTLLYICFVDGLILSIVLIISF